MERLSKYSISLIASILLLAIFQTNSAFIDDTCETDFTDQADIPLLLSISKRFPYTVPGYDYENRTVYLIPVGKWNFSELSQLSLKEACAFKAYISTAFSIFKAVDLGKGNVLVVDFHNFDYYQFSDTRAIISSLSLMQQLGEIEENITYGYFINVDFGTRGFIDLSRPSLGKLINRVKIYDMDKSIWISSISKHFPPSYLIQNETIILDQPSYLYSPS